LTPNSRSYINRFLQPDSIIPNLSNPQSWNRFSYVYNNPVNFIDPSGHRACGDGEEYDCDGTKNDEGGGLTLDNTDSGDKPGCGVSGHESYGFHCTKKDLENATLEQRLRWFQRLQGNMSVNVRPDAGDWFVNIDTVVAGFSVTGQDSNEWVLNVDAEILLAVQDGYVASQGLYQGTLSPQGNLWSNFFNGLENDLPDQELIVLWGTAEREATNIAVDMYGSSTDEDDIRFTTIGNVYRDTQKFLCPYFDCSGGFFDPRTTILSDNMSPVIFALAPIYANDFTNKYIWFPQIP
jgi:hypothetical protein